MAELIGVADLAKAFGEVARDMQKKTARQMVASGGAVIRKEAKNIAASNFTQRSGALVRNIAIKREPKAPAGTEQYNLGVRHGRALGKRAQKEVVIGANGRTRVRYVNDPYYWVMLEVGAQKHRIAPQAKRNQQVLKMNLNGDFKYSRYAVHPGFEGKPFLAPALENKREAAIAAMEAKLAKHIAKANQ